MNNIKKDDLVVVGREGIKVTPPERPRGKLGVFEFMSSEASSEKPFKSMIEKIASEIREVKENGSKIAVVGGPAIVHTGSAPILARMIKEGIIDVVFAGNALATHDIENALYGTSLGVCVNTGEIVTRGHRHHIYAINQINQAGSIKKAVEKGVLKKGIMYECVKNDVPFVLSGSIRDDGPLPDVITDVIEAQDEMRKHIKGVDMVIMIATMLHSIAMGNILPSEVKSICVDINPATVTKLSDRGSAQVVGIVTDVGAFMPMLYQEITNHCLN
jgi:lysine-ketoglutarate reductase/saccharopine dehydrogenase-like protein (TIGR00300 family)